MIPRPHRPSDPPCASTARVPDPGPIRLALTETLAIAASVTDQELLVRTLEAACRLTGAPVGCLVNVAGLHHIVGDEGLATRLLEAVQAEQAQSEPTRHYAAIGLPAVLAGRLGSAVVAVAGTRAGALDGDEPAVFALVLAHAQAALDRLGEFASLAVRANSDPLTGLRHQRPFEQRLDASVPGRTVVIAIDIDNFKTINDEYGHQAGDTALLALVGGLRQALRGDDHIYRIGGDEFAVVIDVTEPREVTAITRRLLAAARKVGYPISVGAALRSREETGRDTLHRADRALYQAKRAGRNTARLAA